MRVKRYSVDPLDMTPFPPGPIAPVGSTRDVVLASDYDSLLAVLRQCVEAAERVRINFYGVLCGDFGSPDYWPGDREGVVNYRELLHALTAAREFTEEVKS